MTIDWVHFAPLSALAGGLLIGVAAALLVLGAGRVLGASGVVGGALDGRKGDAAWRWWLIVGLVAAAPLSRALWGAAAPAFAAGWTTLIVAGFLVGFGARLGSGCTSGHGVCGLARLSPRSFVATAVFMATAFGAVFVARHVVG
jgi:uncharacterized membrane protein YedE/YeeE